MSDLENEPTAVRFVLGGLDDRLAGDLLPFIESAIASQLDPAGCVAAAVACGVHVTVDGDPLTVTCSLLDYAGNPHPLCHVSAAVVGVHRVAGEVLYVPPSAG